MRHSRITTRLRHWSLLAVSLLTAVASSAAAPTLANASTVAAAAGTLASPTTLVPGLTLNSFSRSNGPGESVPVHVLDANLNEPTLRPTYLSSGKVTDTAKLSTMASAAKAVAAVNGDFFDIDDTNAPHGIGISGGDLRHGRTFDYNNTVAFFPNGSGSRAALTQIFLEATITLPGGATLTGTNLNSSLIRDDGIGIYNEVWGSASRATTTHGVTRVREVEIRQGMVSAIRTAPGDAVASGSIVLTGIGKGADSLAGLNVGDPVGISYQPRGADGVPVAIGGSQVLLRDGVVTTESSVRRARTAAGFSADGLRVWFVTADENAGVSGFSFAEMGRLLKDLGADDALNLDGGGSTTMVARMPGASAVSVVNTPSGGSERLIPNGIGFTSTARSTVCSTSPASVFAADADDGQLHLYPLNKPDTESSSWSQRDTIGAGWQVYGRVLGGPGGRLYGINQNGMFRYRWHGTGWDYQDGSWAVQISTGFTQYATSAWRDKITVDRRGDFYLIDSSGNLRWYRYDETTGTWTINGTVIDGGWGQFDLVVAADVGVLYARGASDAKLYRYRFDPETGTWLAKFVKVGDGWDIHTRGIFSVGGDTLFGIKDNGYLYQYRYRESNGTWAIVARHIGSGWQQFANAMATTDTCWLTSSVYKP